MAGRRSLSIEELARRHSVIPFPISAVDLETGMVVLIGDKLRIVISVAFENGASGPVAVVETVGGFERMAANARVKVWHVEGRPFLVDVPEENPVRTWWAARAALPRRPRRMPPGSCRFGDRSGPTSGHFGCLRLNLSRALLGSYSFHQGGLQENGSF